MALGEVAVIFCQLCSLQEDSFSAVHKVQPRLCQVMLTKLRGSHTVKTGQGHAGKKEMEKMQ